jgi:hypothetical protein
MELKACLSCERLYGFWLTFGEDVLKPLEKRQRTSSAPEATIGNVAKLLTSTAA